MKKLGSVLLGILLIGVVANSLSAKTTRYTYTWWTSTVTHDGFGAAIYYGEAVDLTFTPEIRATLNQESGTPPSDATLRQYLQLRGTVYIHRAGTGALIDTREFVAHERVVDEGMDAGTWVLDPGPRYVVTSIVKVETLDYDWKVRGVFHYRHKVRNGVDLVNEYRVRRK